MSSNAEKLYNLIAKDSRKKQSLFLTALTNPKSALDKICAMGKELDIIVTKQEVHTYNSYQGILVFLFGVPIFLLVECFPLGPRTPR